MGCCGPEFRKAVIEEEERRYDKGKEKVPLIVKFISLLIIVGMLSIAQFL